MTKIALLLFVVIFFASMEARAMETLRFKKAESYKEKKVVEFVQKTNKINNLIASVDLNNDALDEYIIKPASPKDCSAPPLCSHQIIALQDREPILIGKFDAHKMLVSNKKTYGIRDIIVYNIPYNDFKSETATWSPFHFRFIFP